MRGPCPPAPSLGHAAKAGGMNDLGLVRLYRVQDCLGFYWGLAV